MPRPRYDREASWERSKLLPDACSGWNLLMLGLSLYLVGRLIVVIDVKHGESWMSSMETVLLLIKYDGQGRMTH